MKAKVIAGNPQDGELINVNGHRIQFGGREGDGFCYAHQSFECIENLSEEERQAVTKAEEEYGAALHAKYKAIDDAVE